MNALDGYKTLIACAVAMLVSTAAQYGVVIDENKAMSLSLLITAVVGIILRHVTKGPAAWREPPQPPEPPV